ncbi:MAG: maltose alpha-D-glucosyltransferase [Methanospirillaceae archaeon]|nr:maltose alpha-D-glucosyltransferase [Methanospirillaceae archaeon]
MLPCSVLRRDESMGKGRKRVKTSVLCEDDPEWYKDAIIYEVHVRAFYDSDGDGIGDFVGLTEKLDYLKDLGITALWLLPFYPSPLKDDGYDISDYYGVHPDYGTLQDFELFLKDAHKREIRVITELCMNHTSDTHPWFQRARRSKKGSKWRNFYVWNDTVEKYKDARIIFKDFESSNWSWDPVAESYYWHRFYSHQPDLNYQNPAVRNAIFDVVDFWFGLGVDGLRLDAVPYLFEEEGTNCENLPGTHQFIRDLRAHVDSTFKNRMLLAEANQWPEDAADYFGDGDEAHMAYHFPLMPRLFLSMRMEDSYPITDIIEQTPPIPESCQWGLFLRNHDELTLEMVTDQERDYMYQVYAKDPHQRINLGIRRRLAPLMRNDRREMELMNVLLFSLPGTGIIYYGEEIGMGDNYYLGDRNGVRTPMQWNSDINAGFSRSNPQQLYLPVIIDPEYHYLAVNVLNQQRNSSSFLWWMKHLISLTKSYRAFSRGTISFLNTKNPKVLAFFRGYKDDRILIIVNLAKTTQYVQLDLAGFAGIIPIEIFSSNKFPQIGKDPYTLTLGPHDYYWLLFQEQIITDRKHFMRLIPSITLRDKRDGFFAPGQERLIEATIQSYMKRWNEIRWERQGPGRLEIIEQIPLGESHLDPSDLIILKEIFADSTSRLVFIPVFFVSGEPAEIIIREVPEYIITRLTNGCQEGILCESYFDQTFRESLLNLLISRKMIRGKNGLIRINIERKYRYLLRDQMEKADPVLHAGKGVCEFVITMNGLSLKLYRSLEEGINPAIDMLRFLNEETDFRNCPTYAGSIEYKQPKAELRVIGIVQEIGETKGNGILFAEDAVSSYFNAVLSKREDLSIRSITPFDLLPGRPEGLEMVEEIIGPFCIYMMDILGTRTGELHLALASSQKPEFAPESFSLLYQRSLYQSFQSQIRLLLRDLQSSLPDIPDIHHDSIFDLISTEPVLKKELQPLIKKKIITKKIRIHGDYHLGNLQFTGKDFIIINFEGDSNKTISERMGKYSPLRDVAGMIWSLYYSTHSMFSQKTLIRPEDIVYLKPWVDYWLFCVTRSFLSSYLAVVGDTGILPKESEDRELLLRIYTIERAVTKIGYMKTIRPDRIHIAIRVLHALLSHTIYTDDLVVCMGDGARIK